MTGTTISKKLDLRRKAQARTLARCQELNKSLTREAVAPIFQAHWCNIKTGQHGLKNLILDILAEYELTIRDNWNSETPICPSDFAMANSQIIACVQAIFTDGSTRYPRKSILHALGVTLLREGKLEKIELTSLDSPDRIPGERFDKRAWAIKRD